MNLTVPDTDLTVFKSDSVISKIKSNKQRENDQICKFCIENKQTRMIYYRKGQKFTRKFELIHSNF